MPSHQNCSHLLPLRHWLLLAGVCLLSPAAARSQGGQTLIASLPEAPLPQKDMAPLPQKDNMTNTAIPEIVSGAQSRQAGAPMHATIASPFAKFILPGQPAPRLNTYDKVVIGFKDSVTPFTAVGWITSATYEQITDGPAELRAERQGLRAADRCCGGTRHVRAGLHLGRVFTHLPYGPAAITSWATA